MCVLGLLGFDLGFNLGFSRVLKGIFGRLLEGLRRVWVWEGLGFGLKGWFQGMIMVLGWGEGIGLKEGELPDLSTSSRVLLECSQNVPSWLRPLG